MTTPPLQLRLYQVGEVRVELRELRLWDDLEGMLEGTRQLHRRMRLRQLDRRLAAERGLYVHDLDAIRADDAARTDTWLPRTRGEARLTTYWRPEPSGPPGRNRLTVAWFQPPAADPFAYLAEIVRPLDWVSIAVFEPDEDW